MADPYPSLFDDPEDPDPEEHDPEELDSLIHKLTTPVKKDNADSKIDLEENGSPEPVTADFSGSAPATNELNGSVPVMEKNNGSLPMVEENNDSLLMVEENNAVKHEMEENNFLRPVLPGESGVGLPYAPENWPNTGDNWRWRVGNRYNAAGYFMDRFLYLPQSLQKTPTSKQMFASKPTIEKYIRSEFPDADVNAFFASFTWKVPAKMSSTGGTPVNGVKKGKTEEKKGTPSQSQTKTLKAKRPRVTTPVSPTPPPSQREKRPRAAAPSSFKPKRQERIVEETPRSSTRKKEGRKSSRLSTLSIPDARVNQEHHVPEEPPMLPIPPDFDNYLNSLEDILTQPVSVIPPSYSMPTDAPTVEDETTEARNKLSSLLMMDFPTLVSSNYYSELVTLATKLRKDPRLTAEQLVKLKLIEEIPLFSEVFLESREIIDQVNGFFANLEGNKSKVSSLKNEYNELKEKADQLQAQVDSNAVAVQEIDNQIAQLQAWRAELVGKIESNRSAKAEVMYTQKMVANGIPPLVQDIQAANAKIPDWELRKSNAEKRVNEILNKFGPLQGFSL